MAFTPNALLQQKTQDRQVDDLQRGIALPFQQLQSLQPVNGRYIATDENGGALLFPTGTTNVIHHGLGRAYVGYIICNMRAGDYLYTGIPLILEDIAAAGGLDTKESVIALTNFGTMDIVADVWVY